MPANITVSAVTGGWKPLSPYFCLHDHPGARQQLHAALSTIYDPREAANITDWVLELTHRPH